MNFAIAHLDTLQLSSIQLNTAITNIEMKLGAIHLTTDLHPVCLFQDGFLDYLVPRSWFCNGYKPTSEAAVETQGA